MNTPADLMRIIPPIRAAAPRVRLSARALAVLALVAANVIWGASAVASKAVLTQVPPLTLACLRVGIALVVLLPLVARNGGRPSSGRATALLGLTGVSLFCLFQNVGLVFATAANTALINGGIPVLTALLAAIFIGERLDGRQVIGLIVSFAGVAAIVFPGRGGAMGEAGLGSILPLASAVSFAAYAVLGRRTFVADNALAVVAGSTCYGFLFLLPGAALELATVGPGPLSLPSVMLLLYLGIGCSALAFVLCGYGLARLDAGQGAVFGNLKPIVGIVLAIVLLGERLSAGQVAGGALVLLGVALACGRNRAGGHRPAPGGLDNRDTPSSVGASTPRVILPDGGMAYSAFCTTHRPPFSGAGIIVVHAARLPNAGVRTGANAAVARADPCATANPADSIARTRGRTRCRGRAPA